MLKHISKIFALLTAMVLTVSVSAHGEETAATIINRTATQFSNAQSVDVKFVMSSGSDNCDGSIVMAKNKFVITTPVLRIWFDGKTQWSWLKSSNEVSITEPTAEELMESNPFKILNSYKSQYNCRKLKAAKGCYKVELTPKSSSSPVKYATVTINASTNWPEAIDIKFTNSSTVSVAIKSIKSGKAVAASTFVYDKKKCPAKSIIDLR